MSRTNSGVRLLHGAANVDIASSEKLATVVDAVGLSGVNLMDGVVRSTASKVVVFLQSEIAMPSLIFDVLLTIVELRVRSRIVCSMLLKYYAG